MRRPGSAIRRASVPASSARLAARMNRVAFEGDVAPPGAPLSGTAAHSKNLMPQPVSVFAPGTLARL